MSDKAPNQPARHRTRRTITISCLLLLLLGGLYWTLSTRTPTATLPPVTPPPALSGLPLAEPAVDSAQHLPDASSAVVHVGVKPSARSVTRQPLARKRVVVAGVSVAKPTDEALVPAVRPTVPAPLVEVPAKAAEDAFVTVAKPVVAAPVETKPASRSARPRPVAVTSIPTEFKPIVRPVPMTANATPATRKTKNDEDVEVDFK